MLKLIIYMLIMSMAAADLSTTTITTGGDGATIIVDPYSDRFHINKEDKLC